ncbi:isoniazid response ATPase/transcriptional regulator IniR [Mycobacterium sp.]|jgi:DNA-binding CsgD family transcriptional regulator|uniref:isoniazid response ATPase/transcriptional regulator IniR n=1 Tax=Mycobacterium sp. TaxID=1785 RepID=UPI002D4F7A03|nr:isoniazid response ATPase/transcriptional regulator IniR [Mycobacterium sp.]HZA12040.1 isoniazid response ATPase/transcriptional regulator IniR [Mycobacterium sp.]
MNAPAPSDIPPQARDAVSALAHTPASPTKLLVCGGIGTGKTTVLSAVRSTLRAADVPVLTSLPPSGEKPTGAIVIDDAHLLADDELQALADRVSDLDATIVVAAEPHRHNGALRALTKAIERENAVVALGALAPSELHGAVAGVLPNAPTNESLRSLMVATAGVPLLVRAALDAAQSLDDDAPAVVFAQAARFALIDRLRRVDEPVLEALLITSLSPELGAADVAAALGLPGGDAQLLVDRARATGLVEASHRPPFLRSVHRAVTQIVGAARHHDVETSLLASQLEMSTLSTDLALRLAEHGMRDDRLANVLQQHAAQSRGQPVRAARLYRAAVDAGAVRLDARLADALALTGDCATAGQLADDLLISDDPAKRAAAVRIAASIAVHDGNSSQAADLFRWLGPDPDAFVSAAGAVVLVGAGDAAAARAALEGKVSGPPTTAARAARSLADGLLLSLDQPFPVAVARLGQALAGDQSVSKAAPDTPAALLALAALHGGDPVRARSVITRALRGGGDDARTPRHRLLLAWVKMQDGQLTSASADVAAAGESSLHRRDALWLTALRTGIARRTGDGGALQKHWYAAMEVLAEYSVDLFSLLPLGELWVAAARLRQMDRLQHQLDQASALLHALGNPVLWSVPLHWSGVHAGILANSPEAVAPHGQALSAAAAHSAFAKCLAGAGRVWLRVLANHVDIDEVTAAGRGLSEFGHTWDATRLASQAALQAADARVSSAMLQLARDLKMASPVDEARAAEPSLAPTAGGAPAQPASTRLSEREREVAELLLLGMPYRDIGGQLFISAKTVEHHVARIRRRLGADSRSEMLSMLRTMLASQS